MHVRYFFVVDKIKIKDVKIVHCSTEKIVADYSIKPAQGALFEFQRNTNLGLKRKTLDCVRNGIRKY